MVWVSVFWDSKGHPQSASILGIRSETACHNQIINSVEPLGDIINGSEILHQLRLVMNNQIAR